MIEKENFDLREKMHRMIAELLEDEDSDDGLRVKLEYEKLDGNIILVKEYFRFPELRDVDATALMFDLSITGFSIRFICLGKDCVINRQMMPRIMEYAGWLNNFLFPGSSMRVFNDQLMCIERYVDCTSNGEPPMKEKILLNFNICLEDYRRFINGAVRVNKDLATPEEALAKCLNALD